MKSCKVNTAVGKVPEKLARSDSASVVKLEGDRDHLLAFREQDPRAQLTTGDVQEVVRTDLQNR